MTRAVLLPTGADPFLLAYWLRHYRTWADSVDELHVGVCGTVPPEVDDYIRALVEAAPNSTSLTRFPKRMPHGDVLRETLSHTKADHVMLVEDDAYIRNPTVVGTAFAALEDGDTDLIGCARDGYATEQFISAARRKFGDPGCGLAFWPTFLFTSRAALEATDKDFGGVTFPAGHMVLGTHLQTAVEADTFVWASFQLRDQGLRVTLREPYHVGSAIPEDAPWFHVGSMSQGHGYLWQRPKPLTEEQRNAELSFWLRLPHGEAAKRIGWWLRMWEHWDGGLPEYHAEYGDGVKRWMADNGLTEGDVAGWHGHYDYLPTWPQS